MSRFVDRGAIIAAYVGIGMAVTMAIGFLLVIPIEPTYVLLSLPGGMVIGYYANARCRPPARRLAPDPAELAARGRGDRPDASPSCCSATRALFFFADSGYPDFNRTDAKGGRSARHARPARTASTSAT